MDENIKNYLKMLLMANANMEEKLKSEGKFNTENDERTLTTPAIVMGFFEGKITTEEAIELSELYNETIRNKRAKEILDSFILKDGVTQEEMERQLEDLLSEVHMLEETDKVQE